MKRILVAILAIFYICTSTGATIPVSYTHLDVYKRQAYLLHIAEALAGAKGITVAELASITTANATALFKG